MLKKKTPATIATSLTLTGQGESITFNITYNNIPREEIMADFMAMVDAAEPDKAFAKTVLKVIHAWDSEFALTEEDLAELETARPGTLQGIMQGFHEARQMEKVKN